jgi:hypothetical protein
MKKAAFIVGAALLVCGLTCVGSAFFGIRSTQLREAREASEPQRAPTPNTPKSALDRMEVAFEGHHSREAIKARMDRALRLYGLPITDENYSRAASVLIVLGDKNNVSEMELLDRIIRSHVPGSPLTFQEAAAFAAVLPP